MQNEHLIREELRSGAIHSANNCSMTWPYQSLEIESETWGELVSSGLNELGDACIQYLRFCFASGSLEPGQPGTLISGLTGNVLLARSGGSDLEDHQSFFRTLWRVHGSWSLAIPAEFSARVCHENVSDWLHDVPELSLLTLLSFHCSLLQAEARQLGWCDVETLDESLATLYKQKFMDSSTSEIEKREEW